MRNGREGVGRMTCNESAGSLPYPALAELAAEKPSATQREIMKLFEQMHDSLLRYVHSRRNFSARC